MQMLPAMSLDEILLDAAQNNNNNNNDSNSNSHRQQVVLAAHQSGSPLTEFRRTSDRSTNVSSIQREQELDAEEDYHYREEKVGTLLVGPEGDFSQRELKLLQESDQCSLIGLGDLRLRVETAALAFMTGVRLLDI